MFLFWGVQYHFHSALHPASFLFVARVVLKLFTTRLGTITLHSRVCAAVEDILCLLVLSCAHLSMKPIIQG